MVGQDPMKEHETFFVSLKDNLGDNNYRVTRKEGNTYEITDLKDNSSHDIKVEGLHLEYHLARFKANGVEKLV